MSAAVLQLETWRDPDGVLRRAVKPSPVSRPTEWSDLLLFSAPGTRDKRTAIRVYEKLGLVPLLLYGVNDDGSCMCRDSDCERSIGKHPVDKNWETNAVDIGRIDRALEKNHRWNIGLRMGAQPGGFRLVALDVDGPRETIAPLEAELGPLPATLTSGSGKGLHLIFRVDADRKFKNSVRVAGVKLDVRCDRGQIVAPPSKHRTGAFYHWVDAREPEMMP